jgi:nucleoside-diphosphate-sugar epimerase
LECEVLFLGFGPITHALANMLIAKGHRIIVITNQSKFRATFSEFPNNSFQTLSWADTLNHKIVSESTFIGWRQPPQSQVLGVELVNWIKSANMKTRKIHHLSSAAVYTGNQEIFSELDYVIRETKNIVNAKQELEKLVLDVCLEKKSQFVNYRISNVYGTGLSQGFINESINYLKRKEPIRIYKNLDLVRDYLLIDDLVGALFDLQSQESSVEVLNISTGLGVRISEVIAQLKVLKAEDLKIVEIEAPKETVTSSVLSCKRLEATIPWTPQPLDKSLESLIKALA